MMGLEDVADVAAAEDVALGFAEGGEVDCACAGEIEEDAAMVGGEDAGDKMEECGFAGSIWSKKRKTSVLANGKMKARFWMAKLWRWVSKYRLGSILDYDTGKLNQWLPKGLAWGWWRLARDVCGVGWSSDARDVWSRRLVHPGPHLSFDGIARAAHFVRLLVL